MRAPFRMVIAAAFLATPALLVAQQPLGDRILRLADSSKKVHSAAMGGAQGVTYVMRDAMQALVAMESLISKELRTIVDSVGWPGRSMVGAAAATAFSRLFVQVRDLPLQERGASLMEKAVAAGEASPLDYAYLADRTRVNGGRLQLYGTAMMVTQFGAITPSPIADSASVDARRKVIGLGPLADSVAVIKQPSTPAGVTIVKPPGR